MDDRYDIIVVGAGPAGSTAAEVAARKGVKVLLIDQRHRIGVPVQCAEFVPLAISRHAQFSSRCVMQEVDTIITHIQGRSVAEMNSPGYMLDRSLFDKELAASAASRGARVAIGTRAVCLNSEGVVVERGRNREIIKSQVIIGADGARSSVARWVGRAPLRRIVALQYEISMEQRDKRAVEVFFDPEYEGGYAWFFPKGHTANVGLGVVPHKATLVLKLLDRFVNELVEEKIIARSEILAKTGGSIPCEISPNALFGNILLAGDAAGHAHPITGAGILNAVLAGEMAGGIAAESINRKNPAYLQTYEAKWRDAFGKPLLYGASKRSFLEENWGNPEIEFEALIRKTWIGFKEYQEGRG